MYETKILDICKKCADLVFDNKLPEGDPSFEGRFNQRSEGFFNFILLDQVNEPQSYDCDGNCPTCGLDANPRTEVSVDVYDI